MFGVTFWMDRTSGIQILTRVPTTDIVTIHLVIGTFDYYLFAYLEPVRLQ